MDYLQQVGVAGILVILVLREVFNFLSRKRNCVPNSIEIARQISDLHAWHNKEDEDGVKIWYVRRSLEDAVNRLSQSIETQTTVLQTIVQETRATQATIQRVEEKIRA